jgi:long-chain acyl-CoA synthetase
MTSGDWVHDRTLLDAMPRHLAAQPDKIAFRCGASSWSFADIDRESNRVANALSAAGVNNGDRVGCLTRWHFECLMLTLAACKIGAVCVPINWRFAPAEVEYVLQNSQCRVLMVDEGFLEPFRGAVISSDDLTPPLVLCTEKRLPGFSSFEDFRRGHDAIFDPVPITEDDAALQLYSSGTTGQPKGVVLSHKGLVSTSRVVASEWNFGESGVLGNPLPTFHVAGMTMLFLTIYTGGQTVAYPEFDPDSFIDGIGRHGVTHSFLVPAMLLFMLQSRKASAGDYKTLELIAYGGSPISERVLTEAMQTFGCRFLQVYGLTEVSGPVTFLMPQDHRTDGTATALLLSAGKPAPETRVRIVEPVTGKDLPELQTGEVWVESIRNLKEYWRDPTATHAAFPEGRNDQGGWFRTGDAGYLKDGYLFINDRIKDMIISGGENIYPAEIENVLMHHPAVFDAAVIGVPDATWGEAVKACVVLKPEQQATGEDIIRWLRDRMAHYKCPKSVDFVTELPRNPSGKILKRILREPFWKDRNRAVN